MSELHIIIHVLPTEYGIFRAEATIPNFHRVCISHEETIPKAANSAVRGLMDLLDRKPIKT